MTTYLVTGGAGFVGSHLCERLAANPDNRVVSLDNYFTGSKHNHVPGVDYIPDSTKNIHKMIGLKPDVVFHLGEYSRVEQSFDDIATVHDFNINGTFHVLEYIRATKAKLVYAGSSTKFAHKVGDYVISPYAWSKAQNTELVKQYAEWFGIDYAITYFYNVYGKREIAQTKYATLIAKYREAMKNGKPLTVVSPGTQVRNFTHVDDIVDGLVLVGENGYGDEYGIGNRTAYSILDVARMFGGLVDLVEPRLGNRMSAEVYTMRTRDLGWQAKRELPAYIEELRKNDWNPV